MKMLSCILVSVALISLTDRADAEFVCARGRHSHDPVALRGGPGEHFGMVDRLGTRTRLDVLDARGAWRYVRVAYSFNQTGWLHSRYVCWW